MIPGSPAYCLVESESEVAQSCLTLCNPMDCSPPGSSVHGILQARILEWVAISFSRGSSQPRDRTQVSHIAGRHFNLWATSEALVNPEQNDSHNIQKALSTFSNVPSFIHSLIHFINQHIFFLQLLCARHYSRCWKKVLVAQLCPTLWDPMDGCLPGSYVLGILQARIVEWVAISFSRGSSRLRDQMWVSCIADGFFTIWATRGAPW